MRSGISTFLSLLLLLSWQTLPAGNGQHAGTSILVLGDSLSAAFGIREEESWVTLLRDRLLAEGYGYTVINASISGDTTSGGLRRIGRLLELHEPGLVIIELGGNDGLRGTPLATIRQNLAAMIEQSTEAGARVILAGMLLPPNYAPYADGFARIYPELAARYDVALIEFFLDGVALDLGLMQADGIHPTAEAQPRLFENVWQVLAPKLPLRPEQQAARPAQPAAATP